MGRQVVVEVFVETRPDVDCKALCSLRQTWDAPDERELPESWSRMPTGSMHVDECRPGDRQSACRRSMRPVGVVHAKKGWQILFRCERCGVELRNRVAHNTLDPDDIETRVRLRT